MQYFFRSRGSRIVAFLSGGLFIVSLLPFAVGAQPASAPPGGVVDATFNTVTAGNVSGGVDAAVMGGDDDDIGVYGESSNGTGVSGVSNFNYGVEGSGTRGVFGVGATYGVYGTGPTGVYGTGTNYGLYSTGANTGIYGNGNSFGMYGISASTGAYFARSGGNSVLLGTAGYAVDATGGVRSSTTITSPQYCISSNCITSWAQAVVTNSVVTNSITNNNVTYTKLQDMNSDRLLGRDAAGVGDPAEISLTGSLVFTGSNSIQLSNDNSSPGNSKYYGTNSGGTKGFYDLPSSGGGSLWTSSGDIISPTASYDTLKVGTTSGFGDSSMNSGIVASGYYSTGKYSAVTSSAFPTFTYDGRAGMSISNGSTYGSFGEDVLFFVANYLNQPTIMAYFIDGGSYAYKLGGTSWGNMSDLRLKDRVTPYERGLHEIMALEPIRYHYKADMDTKLHANPDEEYTGFGAQDVQKVIPEAVNIGKDGYLTLNADPIHWAAINAIKELKAENDELKSRIEALEAKLQ